MTAATQARTRAALEVLVAFLKLGLTSFGGPVAHIGYFRREFVERRRWLDDETFTDLVGLCQFLPGPASSQTGFSIGLLRAGWLGGLAAWCGFTLPSVLLLVAFAVIAPRVGGPVGDGLIHGLKLVAVAVVAQAVWDMARRLCPDRRRAGMALAAIVALGVLTTVYAQVIVIGCGAVLGLVLCRETATPANRPAACEHEFRVSRTAGVIALAVFCALLFGLPLSSLTRDVHPIAIFDAFYRSGALVFGGGHVVLPLLQQQTVATGWISPNDFLAGYGAAQAVPGPLFTFASYLGWMAAGPTARWAGALVATAGIFLPGLLLVVAALPWWQALRSRPSVAAMLAGVNAAVVGLLGVALYSPVWTSAVRSAVDFGIAVCGFVLLTRWKTPPLAVVVLCALAGIAESVWR
ncbi:MULTISPECIES: chromate efflux transporter [unclassified Caballeronia]|uniref:chromate efflux transporter n=1 Tax=unclassified Caballeronia TaxID=2646786 RepID=UPI00285A38F4|nr:MULTISPECIES: chromate efflux transporter [unclassified Caballeronia]MDR5741391.1 chromate efflux transporter [Caballeronia sp. LZ016]MDR5807288.1 chromate efflux transporter [Caballeronia sp. LZ019]